MVQWQRRSIQDLATNQSREIVQAPNRIRYSHTDNIKKFNPRSVPKAKCKVICIASGKGGTGKTTVTTNLANALGKMGLNVLLLDADMGLANAHLMMGINPKVDISDFFEGDRSLEDVIIKNPDGVSLIPGGTGKSELTALDDRQLRYLARSLLEDEQKWQIALVDLSAGISAQVMRFLEPAHEIILVVNPEITSLMDAYALIKSYVTMFPRRKFSAKLVINRVIDEDEAKSAFRRIKRVIEKHISTVDVGFLSYILFDKSVTASISSRKPLIDLHPRSKASKCIFALAQRVYARYNAWQQHQQSGGFIKSYFAVLEKQSYD